jgi:RNA polymerase sigma factor (sigma-70 family)
MSTVSLPLELEKVYVAQAQAAPAGFAPLYEHYFPHLRRFFSVKLTDEALIEDLTARTFEKALTNIGQFTFQGYSFSAWLYRIAINLYNDHFRREGRKVLIPLDESLSERLENGEESAHEQSVREWQSKQLKSMLAELPPKQREIIYWKFYRGLSNKQIAVKLELSDTNVSSIVHRVVKQLRELTAAR